MDVARWLIGAWLILLVYIAQQVLVEPWLTDGACWSVELVGSGKALVEQACIGKLSNSIEKLYIDVVTACTLAWQLWCWKEAERWCRRGFVEPRLQTLCHKFSFFAYIVAETFKKRLSRCPKRLRRKGCEKQVRKRQSGVGNEKRFCWRRNKLGLQFLLLTLSSWSVEGMDQQQFSNFIEQFSSYMHRQGVMAENTATAIARLGEGGSSSSSLARNLESAAKILKPPEVFDSSDASVWINWRHSFLNWLAYSNQDFIEGIKECEKLAPHEEVEDDFWSDAQKEISRKLYSILTSYLRGSKEAVCNSVEHTVRR